MPVRRCIKINICQYTKNAFDGDLLMNFGNHAFESIAFLKDSVLYFSEQGKKIINLLKMGVDQ